MNITEPGSFVSGHELQHNNIIAKEDKHFLLIITSISFIILLLLSISPYYGYFRDELYYIACTKHPALGYVDHPPFSIFILTVWRWIFGDSLVSLRILSSLSGACTVFMTALIAQKLGGRKFAQGMSALSIMIAPLFLGINSFYSMNTLEILLWTICAYFLIRLLKANDTRYWVIIGIVIGLGLLNKHTFAVFILGLFLGLLFTRNRKQLTDKWLWTGVLIALVILLPNIVWQITNRFPSLEFYRNADLYKNVKTPPLGILMGQILTMHPFNFPIWLAGLYFLMKIEGNKYRALGWIYIICFVIMIVSQSSRPDRLAALYPMLLAPGSVFTERMIFESKRFWLSPVILIVLFISGIITAPLIAPILPPEQLVRYANFIGIHYQFEKGKKAQLPQPLADRLGWEDMARNVSEVYNKLSPNERKTTAVFTGNYGEAGALEMYSKQYNLPPVLCSHNSYFQWGHGSPNYKTIIVIGIFKGDIQKVFDKVEQASWYRTDYAMDYENNIPIYLARYPKHTLEQIWPGAKHFE